MYMKRAHQMEKAHPYYHSTARIIVTYQLQLTIASRTGSSTSPGRIIGRTANGHKNVIL